MFSLERTARLEHRHAYHQLLLALAPMAGVTDAAFRQICAELGAGYTITELISSKALCYHDKKRSLS